ncbi:TPA: ArsR family transcriptional regulator [Candidatus Poribacteria bacterium]|nr:ArsR family transcriptional regulator [Candidatus Poribacteria bacterium]HEX28915.1 ArsR family transcriptional regulator [Candidatus Poribacteria bacterium]
MEIRKIVHQLKALADEGRMTLFLILWRRECCVCELMNIMGWEQSRVSHQLKLLRFAELVENRREGKWMIYFIPEEVRRDELVSVITEKVKLPADIERRIEMVKEINVRECVGSTL